MQDTMLKFRALFKAQSALTRIELRAKATQAVYGSLALVFGLLGLGMLNVGAFLALEPVVGGAWSAVLLGVADALLAGVIAKAAAGVTPGNEGDTARELRDMVLDSLAADAGRVKQQYLAFQGEISRVKTAVSTVSSGAAGILPGLSSIVHLLTSALKKKRKKN